MQILMRWCHAILFKGLITLYYLSCLLNPTDLLSTPTPLYSSHVTLKALRHPRGSLDALRYLHQLPPSDLLTFKTEELLVELDHLALDSQRSLQVRIWSIELLKRLKAPREVLKQLWLQSHPIHSTDVKEQHTLILARHAVLALRGLARPDLLSGALNHPDPEIRAHAASAGADPHLLCHVLTQDPWPEVRYQAVLGLEKIGGEQALCLSQALKDTKDQVQEQAARVLGLLSHDPSWSPTLQQRKDLIKGLRALAGTPSAPLNARASALISLGRWDSLEPSDQVLKTHLDKGGIVPLTLAALQAVALSSIQIEERVPRLIDALKKSTALEVRLKAAGLLVKLDTKVAIRAVQRVADQTGGREASYYLKLLQKKPLQVNTLGNSPIFQGKDPLVPDLDDEAQQGL